MKNYLAVVGLTTWSCWVCLHACRTSQRESAAVAVCCCAGCLNSLTCGPGNMAVGDLNSDGKPDLVVSCGDERILTVLLNTGGRDEHFRKSVSLTLPDPPGDMVLGDVNGDKNLDLAIDSHDSYGVVLLLGDGKGALALAPNSPIVMKEGQHPHTHGLAMGDMNGDGKLDLITANNADNDVSIAFGDGRGRFTRAPNAFAVGPSPYPFALGDINTRASRHNHNRYGNRPCVLSNCRRVLR